MFAFEMRARQTFVVFLDFEFALPTEIFARNDRGLHNADSPRQISKSSQN